MENPGIQGKLSPRTKWTYSLGGIGRDMAYSLYSGSLITFILFTKNITDAQFIAINTIMVICRIWDAVNDPIMGGIVESTVSRYGKFKPWILIGVLSNSLILLLMFGLPITGWAFVWLFLVLYLLWDITYTMNDIGYWSMLPALTSDVKERNTLTSMANLFAGIGSIMAGGLIPLLTTGSLAIGGNAVTAYTIITAVIVAIFIGCQVLTVAGVKEGKAVSSAVNASASDKIGFKRMLKVIFRNDQLLWISLVMLLFNIARYLIMGFYTLYIYLEFGYNGTLTTIFVAIFALPAILLNVVYPKLAAKFTQKTLQFYSLVISIVGYSMLFLTGTIWPMSFPMLCIAVFLLSIGQTLMYTILTIAISNTVEYNEWKFKTRDEGIIFSIRPFVAKLGTALQQMFSSIIYLAVGITAITNQISDAENAAKIGDITSATRLELINNALSQADQGMKFAFRAFMSFLPIIFIVLSYIVLRKKYKIDEKMYEQIIKDIAMQQSNEVMKSEE